MARFLSMRLTPLVLLFLAFVLGCGGDGDNGGTPPPTITIAKAASNSGDAQTGSVGQPLAAPLQVVVTEDGAASSGRTVTWSSTVAGASLNPASAVTDASGIASSAWTLGNTSGSQSAQATLSGATGSPVTFTATAAAGAAASLSTLSGDNQSAQIGAQLGAPVQAKVSDPLGNGVEGVSVAWAATGGTVSAATVPSDAAGTSAVNVTMGSIAGPVVITATAGDLAGSPLTFNATATTAPTTAQVSVADNSFTPSALTITAGTTVTWRWSSTASQHNVAPDGTVPPRSGNPVNGSPTYQFTFNTPGTYGYHCEVHGAPGSGMSGTITVQ